MNTTTSVYVALGLTVLLLASCSRETRFPPLSGDDSLAVILDNTRNREAVHEYLANDPGSPFQRDTTVTFTGLKWYPVNPRFRGVSQLHRYAQPETVIVMETQGEERKQLLYGYFEFPVPDENNQPAMIRLNAYKFTPYDAKRFQLYPNNLSVWFTDRTTGKETYGVGRYVNVEDEQSNPDHLYTIDLNKAYNPYCAYSDMFTCAIPRKEDHVDVAIRAGEMTYADDH